MIALVEPSLTISLRYSRSRREVKSSKRMKLEPGTTAKSLPWLDGNPSLAVRASPPATMASASKTAASDGAIESPLRIPQTLKIGPESPVERSSTTRTAGSAPTFRRGSLSSPIERRTSSARAIRSSPETQRRLSFAPSLDTERLENRSSSAKPPQFGVQRSASIVSPVVATVPGHTSPTQPIPKRNPFENARDKKRLSNAIEELEDLVDEAVILSKHNTNQVQVQEIYEIIEDATIAVQEASTLSPPQHPLTTNSPLEVSGSSEAVSGCSNGHCLEHATRPIAIDHEWIVNVSEKLADNPLTGPGVIDWAYKHGNLRSRSLSSTLSSASSSDSSGLSRSRYSSRSNLLLRPEPAQIAARQCVEVVPRPTRHRGRSRRRKAHRSDIEGSQHRPQSFQKSPVDYSGRRNCIHQRKKPNSSDSSFDSGERLRFLHRHHEDRRYRQELNMHDQVHHQTFGLGRHHCRQPIARNWSTKKKRITAVIACINTSLLGIIVGIYVLRDFQPSFGSG